MFIELGLPKKASGPIFYVHSFDENLELYLRNDSKGIDDGNDDVDKYVFKTIGDAHKAAKEYYKANAQLYPYEDHYQYAVQHDINSTPDKKLFESEVMEFI